jgi:hypothetical protein
MLKVLLIIVLVIYALSKLGLFRIFVQSNQRGHYGQSNGHRPPGDGNVNIDNIPNQKKSDFKGGEYVDYEEVK